MEAISAVKINATQISTAINALKAVVPLTIKLHQRIVGLLINERLQDQLCRQRVQLLQDALQSLATTASNINDSSMLQKIIQIENNLNKCLSACDRIEQQPYFVKFTSNSSDVEELSSLLSDSLQIIPIHLAEANYSNTVAIKRTLEQVEAVARNPQAGIYPLDGEHADRNMPERIEKPLVEEKKPGVLQVSWKSVADARYYELEYDQHKCPLKVEQTSSMRTKYLLDIEYASKFSYDIRVRGVYNGGPGEWSEYTVGKFTVLPSQPHLLALHINSSTSVTLVVGKAPEELGVKPVTDYVVMWHNHEEIESSWIERVFAVSELEALTLSGRDAYKINLDWNTDATSVPMYQVKISLRNADGDSLPYKEDVRTDKIQPGEPVELEVVIVTTRTIIIKWSMPETNAYIVDHYEVHWGRNGNVRKTENCHAVFRGLGTWEKYHFKVRSVSKTGIKSGFLEIVAVTKSMPVKVAKTIGAGVAVGAAGIMTLNPTTRIVLDRIAAPFAMFAAPFLLIAVVATVMYLVLYDINLDYYLEQYPDDSAEEGE